MNYTIAITHGKAIQPYKVVKEESFHTEFAARLFGSMTCRHVGEYHYWSFTQKPGPANE